MPPRKKVDENFETGHRAPATTPESRENQMVALAVAAAEKQLRDGTASAQVITHYLKLGSSREKLEQERLRQENILAEARVEQIKSQQNVERLYEEAIAAMRSYSGHRISPDVPEDFVDFND